MKTFLKSIDSNNPTEKKYQYSEFNYDCIITAFLIRIIILKRVHTQLNHILCEVTQRQHNELIFKRSRVQAIKIWRMWMIGSTYLQPQHEEEVGRLALCLAIFTPEKPQYSFYRRSSGPQDQSGHEGVKKTLPLSATWVKLRPSSLQPRALPFEYIDHCI